MCVCIYIHIYIYIYGSYRHCRTPALCYLGLGIPSKPNMGAYSKILHMQMSTNH